MQTFDFEITPIAECAETYKAAGATITDIHICARTINPNASGVQMCRGNNSNQIKFVSIASDNRSFSLSQVSVEDH